MVFLKKDKLKVNGGTYAGMACPQVADRRRPPYIEVSCEYIQQAVADSSQEVALQLGS
jgi:hypothetical protein